MIKRDIYHILLFILLGQVQLAGAEQIAVIVAKDSVVQSLSQSYLERIYRRKVLINKDGLNWVPINLSAQHSVRIAFSKALFNQLPEQMEGFWNIQYFKGITPPYVVSSEQAMLRFVATTNGAIGYVPFCYLDDTVQLVFKIEVPRQSQAFCQ